MQINFTFNLQAYQQTQIDQGRGQGARGLPDTVHELPDSHNGEGHPVCSIPIIPLRAPNDS